METYGLEKLGILNPTAVYRNLDACQLTEHALRRGEGTLTKTGALLVLTGKYTGRSPKDKFIVDSKGVHDEIAWGNVNRPISQEKFDALYEKMVAYLQNREIFMFDGFAGADPKYKMGFRVINELASQNQFIHNLLIRPTEEELANYKPDFNVIVCPGFKCDPERDGVHSEAAIIIDYERGLILIAGSGYAGEIKKAVFSTMNYFMTKRNVFPMHSSANMGPEGDTAVFFGLSGTGKTTLSADPNRFLIGDDEHGWSPEGVFNFEGGCYAKCINLSAEGEPEIYNAIKFGSVVENVVMDPVTRELDFDDNRYTDNTRVGYPIHYIDNAVKGSMGGIPHTVIFLTADAFGVLPPVSLLTPEQAEYYFVSGYTAKVAGTERGITEPQATFSTCFGEPFLPLDPSIYAGMLKEKVNLTGARVYLINTGWAGGAYGVGNRMKLRYTRAMVTAALNGELAKSTYTIDPVFGVQVPDHCTNVPDEFLHQDQLWANKEEYQATAKKLAGLFVENFKKYTKMPQEVVNAGPKTK